MPIADLPPEPPLVAPTPVALVLSHESVQVADGVKMGMAGLSYLRPLAPHWWGGAAVYGATHGDRGGFFAWGLASAYRLQQGPWQAEAGLFIGGGGGSPSWVGSGLMIRPHAALSYAWGPLSAGLGVSHLRFAGTQLSSTQPVLTLAWTSDAFIGQPGGDARAQPLAFDAHAAPGELAAVVGRYSMLAASVRRDGSAPAPDLRVVGVAYRRTFAGAAAGLQAYGLLGAAGSVSGVYAGYAELFGGFGVQAGLPAASWPLRLRIEAAVGSGGAGAALDSGGGLLHRVAAALVWQPTDSFGVSAGAGRVDSRGPFRARETRLELAWQLWDVVPGGPAPASEAAAGTGGMAGTAATANWAPWSFSAGLLQAAHVRREDGRSAELRVSTLKLEREIGSNWRLLGAAAIAVSGGAGGYAKGQLGAGWLSAPVAGWRFGGEATLGAAGGGGVQAGSGLIAQAQAQTRYALSDSTALQFDAGWLRNRDGSLSSPIVGISAVVSFSRLQSR